MYTFFPFCFCILLDFIYFTNYFTIHQVILQPKVKVNFQKFSGQKTFTSTCNKIFGGVTMENSYTELYEKMSQATPVFFAPFLGAERSGFNVFQRKFQ